MDERLAGQAPGRGRSDRRGSVQDRIRAYQQQWNETLAETLEKHREILNAQYQSGIEAIHAAFRTTEAKIPKSTGG